jgi:3-oxoadipate enol-lactonase
MPTVQAGDAEVAYSVQGTGPGLVLVHGTGANGTTTWSPMLARLAAARTVIVPDLRGSGATEDPGEPLDVETLAEDVLTVATDAGLEDFDITGFSLGAAVAATVAAAAPDRVRSLVIIATAPAGTDSRTQLQFDFWKQLYSLDASLFAQYWLLAGFSPDFVAAIPPDELRRAASFPIEPGIERQSTLNARIDLTSALPSIRARTLVIGCRHDAIVPPAQTRALADAIPGAAYLELDAGHMVILEAPRLVAAKILEHAAID